MRQLLSLPVACLLLATAFAGCMGGADEPAAPVEVAANQTDVSNATVDDGTSEMNTSVGAMPHLHDYWKGAERMTIMDDDVEVDQFSAIGFTFFDIFMGTPGVGGQFFTLPEGSLVFEGTGKMEITASWSDPTVTGVGIRYKTPGSSDFSDTLPLTQAAPVSLDITPEMTDMPHDKESRWNFLLVPGATGQSVVGKVHFKMDIIRMRDITLFPGHPQLFLGEHTLTLFDGVAKSTQKNFATTIVGFATQNREDSSIRSGKVVPMETRTMTANVTITSATANVGTVSSVDFLYKPAGSFGSKMAQVISHDEAAGVYQFAWPVEMQQADSPYAKESQWTFDLLIHSEAADGLPERGIADSQVDYTVQIVAYDSLLEGVDPPASDD
ncbi:MAG TPA: hypothetical protein VM370_06395 [Candidatus Thermoplasmatota archaeon]|nr:hypothetical protein [Candidatus Thermoplasmatota archaeon]